MPAIEKKRTVVHRERPFSLAQQKSPRRRLCKDVQQSLQGKYMHHYLPGSLDRLTA